MSKLKGALVGYGAVAHNAHAPALRADAVKKFPPESGITSTRQIAELGSLNSRIRDLLIEQTVAVDLALAA